MKCRVTKLKVLRVALGKSQADLAHEAKLSQGFISMIETGKLLPLGETAKRIAAVFEEDPKELFT